MTWFQRLFAILIVKPFFRLFFDFQVSGKENTKNLKRPLLLIANHKSVLDHFALGAALPVWAKIYPFKFMGEVEKFNSSILEFLRKIGFIKLFYTLFGVFPAIKGEGLEKALEIPKKIIENKQGMIIMYPEGHIVHKEGLDQFKRGAPALAILTEVGVLPAALKKEEHGLRKKYHISFGPTFTLPKNMAYETGAEHMRSIIKYLYKAI